MPTWNQLRGLNASDRSQEEQQSINQQMGYKEKQPNNTFKIKPTNVATPINTQPLSSSGSMLGRILNYQNDLNEQYADALADYRDQFGVSRNSINENAESYIDKIGNQFSSYYKRFKGTDKLPLSNQQYKELAAQYQARKNTYGEDAANTWLDNTFKDIVGEHQSWWEQAINATGSLLPTIEGGAVEAVGNIYGLINPIVSLVDKDLDLPDNKDLNLWDNYWNNIIDNPITRLGNDITQSQASYLGQTVTKALGLTDETAGQRIENMKNTATKYNPQGIGAMPIVTTSNQDNSLVSSATPWQALQSGGFTTLSIIEGAGLAKLGQGIFKMATGVAKLAKTGRNLERALEGIKKFQNATEPFVIGGIVGSGEGAIEGLQTKMQVESEALNNLDNTYKEKVAKEAMELYNSDKLNPFITTRTDRGTIMRRKYATPQEAFKVVWDRYKDQYAESRRQIDWAASKAGVQNFWANSIINGMLNNTFKAGLAAPRVQEAIRNNRLTSWAYRNPRFSISSDNVVTPKISKLNTIKQVLKEPFGEGLEEYLQSLSNDVFSGAAENNINEFIQNKFNGDGTVKIGDTFASDWGAAATAFRNSVTDTGSLQSAILGSVSSVLGTVGGIGRAYHRDENGNLVGNKWMLGKNLLRGYNANGSRESLLDYVSRITPWRSGLVNAVFDRRNEIADANEVAATLTEWLQDPTNQAKWDGLTGTANWMTQMEKASESNDQFNYRKAQMGRAINDVFMLSKLKGTRIYDSTIEDLQRVSEMDVDSAVAQSMIEEVRKNGGEEFQGKSDGEIIEKIQSNANKMLGLMSTVENESNNLDRLFGRMDEDTKQSLIYGKLMEKDFAERRDNLEEEINNIASNIKSSRGSSNATVDDDLKKLIMKYGSVNKAVRALSKLQEQKEKAEKKVDELSNINKDKRSDKQNKELVKNKNALKSIDRQLQGFDGLYEKDDKGKSTGKIDASLLSMVLNEQEIMDLDPVTRAMVLAQGADKLYNATHQDRQAVDKINGEIDVIDRQIDTLIAKRDRWINPEDGSIKKHHHKQVQKADNELSDLRKQRDKKLRELNAAQGDMNSKPIYNDAQQQVIDNLIQQGQQMDEDFLDKVVDMGRLEKGIKDYHTQYQAILADPNVFQNYVLRTKYNAARDLTRRRIERVANIEDFEEYSREIDKLMANASQQEANDIVSILREKDEQQKAEQRRNLEKKRIDNWQGDEDGQLEQNDKGEVILSPKEKVNILLPESNFDRYRNNIKDQTNLIRQFAKNPNLTDNDQSLLIAAMQYLQSKGISVTDREKTIDTLLEKDDEGHVGGKFRQWVEEKNDNMPVQQRSFMPVFTTIGQVVSDYAKLLDGHIEDAINSGNINPVITDNSNGTVEAELTTPPPTNPPVSSSLKENQFVDGDGTITTDAQTQDAKDREEEKETPDTEIEEAFWDITTPKIAKLLNIADNIIVGSKASKEVKDLARQYFMDIAVNRDVKLDTIDDVLVALQEKIELLKQQSANQEEYSNNFAQAQGILQNIYKHLYAYSKSGNTAMNNSTRTESTTAGWIQTANIAFMESKNPNAWAVRFYHDHDIDGWNREHILTDRKDPIYFITDSTWTAEVTSQMTPTSNNPSVRKYDTLTDMPIVAVVKVDEPKNKNTTTAIEINGQWYQPIGIMPSTKSRNSGSVHTGTMRKLASKDQGRHFITADGLPNGNPLITWVYGANYLTAHHPDDSNQKRQNTRDNNKNVEDNILKTLSAEEYARLTSMPREKMLDDETYQAARNKFLNGLGWNEKWNTPEFIPDRMRPNGSASPILVFRKEMALTTDRATGEKTLLKVLQDGTNDEIVNFNSRTSRLYDEVIRPAFSYYSPKDKDKPKNAKIITKEDLTGGQDPYKAEATRLTNLFNGIKAKGITNFIYMSEGWHIRVTSPESLRIIDDDIDKCATTYKVFLENEDSEIQPIEIGEIKAGQQNTDDAMNMLRNLLYDNTTDTVRSFLKWQVPKEDALNVNNADSIAASKPRRNYASMVDDGIFEMSGSSLEYDFDGVKLRSPFNSKGEIAYPNIVIANPSNAQGSGPLNSTPQAEGGIETKDGESIEPDSGAILSNNPPSNPPKNNNLEAAEKLTKKIIADSKEFTLSEDETYYYITDKKTGKRIKYLRVTTVIGADTTASQWFPNNRQIYNKIAQDHSVASISYDELDKIETGNFNALSQATNVSIVDIKKAVAELRTEHKHASYGAWSTPSTAIGNTADIITRDFFAGKLKDNYPNISKENLTKLVLQLKTFKGNIDAKGIHIVPEGIMAHGKITVTAEDGTTHEVKVAGTLDLFGYDEEGNYYIFDMKTKRNITEQKIADESPKWSRQISMYADLLRQSYPELKIDAKNLRIIPINVNYPTPRGSKKDFLNPLGPKYSVTPEGQLQMTYGDKDPIDFITSENDGTEIALKATTLEDQVQPGYTKFNINWDNLSSEDQDIANGIEGEINGNNNGDTGSAGPKEAHIETPQLDSPSFISPFLADDGDFDENNGSSNNPTPSAPPITPAGQQVQMPKWEGLSGDARLFMAQQWAIESLKDYNDVINDPANAEVLKQDLKCRGLL